MKNFPKLINWTSLGGLSGPGPLIQFQDKVLGLPRGLEVKLWFVWELFYFRLTLTYQGEILVQSWTPAVFLSSPRSLPKCSSEAQMLYQLASKEEKETTPEAHLIWLRFALLHFIAVAFFHKSGGKTLCQQKDYKSL